MSGSSPVLIDGPWEHRSIAARGTRFHVAEMGTGPLVLFLHGFPQFWWSWRSQLPTFAAAGYRAAAMDLRGYGASDHTPRGYDFLHSPTMLLPSSSRWERLTRSSLPMTGAASSDGRWPRASRRLFDDS